MAKKIVFLIFLVLPYFLFSDTIGLVKIDTTINPVVAEFLKKEIKNSFLSYRGFIIQLDTPGGLLDSTREIITEILNSPIPVICYVDKGSRAASAGFFILIACDVSIMNTNSTTGAATPVSLIGEQDKNMINKIIEDTKSYAKSLAERKKIQLRPVIDAIVKGRSYTSKEAKELGIIDYVVENIDDIKRIIMLSKITKNGKDYIFSDIRIEYINIPWYKKLMAYLYNPTLVYILLILGIYGIIFEFFTPGIGFPGIFGVFSITLALVGLSIIPVSYGGLFLIIIGIILFIMEVFIVSYGLLTIGGSFFVILGSFLYFDRMLNTVTVTITTLTILVGIFLLLVISKSIRLRKSESFISIIGKEGIVKENTNPLLVSVEGEIWQAVSSDILEKGEIVRVKNIKNLLLEVEKVKKTD